jgi:hypothetical protein
MISALAKGVTLLAVGHALLGVTVADAASFDGLIWVLPFSGPGGQTIQRTVTHSLQARRVRVVTHNGLESAARKLPRWNRTDQKVLVEALEVAIIVEGRVKETPTPGVDIIARDGQDGSVLSSASFSGATLAEVSKVIESEWWSLLDTALHPTEVGSRPVGQLPVLAPPVAPTAAPSPSPTGAPKTASEPPPAGESEQMVRKEGGSASFELVLGPRLVARRFSYENSLPERFTPYAPGEPVVALGIAGSWISRVGKGRYGIAADGEFATSLAAWPRNGLAYDAEGADYQVAALFGYVFDGGSADLELGGGRHWFSVIPQGRALAHPRPIPDTDYQYLRAGVHVRTQLTAVIGLFGRASYRQLISAGEIGSVTWFPRLQTGAGDGALGLAGRIHRSWEARLAGTFRSYVHDFNGQPGDVYRGTTAVDNYFGVQLSLAAAFGGGDP